MAYVPLDVEAEMMDVSAIVTAVFIYLYGSGFWCERASEPENGGWR